MDMPYTLIIRYINGRVRTWSAPSLERAYSILNRKKEIHGRLMTYVIYENGKKVKHGWN